VSDTFLHLPSSHAGVKKNWYCGGGSQDLTYAARIYQTLFIEQMVNLVSIIKFDFVENSMIWFILFTRIILEEP
jgi:hypothetical protein